MKGRTCPSTIVAVTVSDGTTDDQDGHLQSRSINDGFWQSRKIVQNDLFSFLTIVMCANTAVSDCANRMLGFSIAIFLSFQLHSLASL